MPLFSTKSPGKMYRQSSAGEVGSAREESQVESRRENSPRSLPGSNKRELEGPLEGTDLPGRQEMDSKRQLTSQSKASEYILHETEQVKGTYQRDKLYQSPDSTRSTQFSHASRHAATQQHTTSHEGSHMYSSRTLKHAHYETAPEYGHGYRRDGDDPYSQPARYKEHRRSDEAKANTAGSSVSLSSQTSELRKQYEALWREYDFVRSELKAKTQRLDEKDSLTRSLTTDVNSLQRRYDEQSAVLTSVRNELKSCQSQLDNVQRFISTADTHADLDIIQKLQGLNEEVYKISMTMADFMAEGFTARQTKELIPVGEDVLAVVGQVMVNHLATLQADDDIALFLQIAFQAYLSHFLYHIASSWTIDRSLNTLIEETYQRIRNAETQAISGRWRSLTRTHMLSTPVSSPNILLECAVAGLSNIVMAAGLFSSQHDAASKLSSKFGEKILSIVSRVGKFGNMISEMISGDFAILAVQPGAMFDKESMVNMTEDNTLRGKREAQTVLCVSRVGLKKQMGEKTITLTKAQIVLESFLG